MKFEYYFYLSIIASGIISAGILLSELRRLNEKLPKSWQESIRSKKFSLSICFLMTHLIITLICESISCYFSNHGIYNHFIASICFTLSFPFLFGFFYIHTNKKWKRHAYFIIYISLITRLIFGGYYHPNSIMPVGTVLFIFSAQFLVALLHLSDLLLNPKMDFFKFLLQVNLNILIHGLIAAIVTSAFISGITNNSDLIFYVQFITAIIFYLLFAIILIKELFKLRRK